MKNTPSAGDQGSSVPELEVDEVVAQRAAPHMPQPPLEVEHESRSVVIADPESDEDGPTPARGMRSPFAESGSGAAEPPSAPLAAPIPSSRPRQLEEYARRREKTVVIDRKRNVPPSLRPRGTQPARGGTRHWQLVVAVFGICALAFAIGGLLSHLGSRRLGSAPPAASSSLPLPASALVDSALAAPVKLSDLPIEPATDVSARSASSASRARPRSGSSR